MSPRTLNVNDGDNISAELGDFEGEEVHIPSGRYTVDSCHDILSIGDVTADTSVIGDGSQPGDVVIDWENDWGGIFDIDNGVTVRYENIEFAGDLSQDGYEDLNLFGDGTLEMVGCWFTGAPDSLTGHDTTWLRADPDKTGTAHLMLRNCLIQNMGNNGLYISNAGKDHNDFSWDVEECVFRNCNVAQLRVGTSGSVRNCLFINDGSSPDIDSDGTTQRQFRVRQDGNGQADITVENCEFINLNAPSARAQPAFADHSEASGANVTVKNCRVYNETSSSMFHTSTNIWNFSGCSITGSGDTGVPSESGSGFATGSGAEDPFFQEGEVLTGTQDFGAGGGARDNEELFVIQAAEQSGGAFSYSFTVDGDVRAGANSEIGNNDSITEQSDGTWLVSGETGSGYADDWVITGEVSDFQASTSSSNYTLLAGGQEVTSADMPIMLGEVPNTAPTATIEITGVGDMSVTVSGEGSSDPDGNIVSYDWTVGNATASGPTTTFTFEDTGEYVIELTVTDDRGATATATRTVSIDPEEKPPAANFDVVVDGLVVELDGTASFDPDGSITNYEWTVGNQTLTGPTQVVQYETAGDKVVGLTVTDNDGMTDTLTRTITVSEQSGSTPGTSKLASVAGVFALGAIKEFSE